MTGNLIWLEGSDNITDIRPTMVERTAAKIETAIVDDYMIKLHIPNSEGHLESDYNINLIRDDSGTLYRTVNGEREVTCELFENERSYLIYGEWVEGNTYLWWAKILKVK